MQELTLKQVHRQSHDDLEVAARRFGHGSLESMSFKLGLMNARSLPNKLNPNFDNAHMSWQEAWEVVRHAQDLTAVRTELATLGYGVAPLPKLQAAPLDAEVYLRSMMSKFSSVVCLNDAAKSEKSEAGREYSRSEKLAINQDAHELIAAILGFVASIEE